MLLFVVCCYSGGNFNDVREGLLEVTDESGTAKKRLAQYRLSGKGSHTANILCAMHRPTPSSEWKLKAIDQPANGAHFMDILDKILTEIRAYIPTAKETKLAFAMSKGDVFLSGRPNQPSHVGWDTDSGKVDLDASCVLLDEKGNVVEPVYFGNLESKKHGITHSGDNLTGDGDGDDEVITCRLDRVGPDVATLFFVINIYTLGKTFKQVANPFCRVMDPKTGCEFCRYQVLNDPSLSGATGLIIARMERDRGGRWGFHAMGQPANGRTYADCVGEMRRLQRVETGSLGQKGGQGGFELPFFGRFP
ncbi:unnamed protein product [Vitrella brassicaformis CCMP3155]|uniref:TerD domain-containing protein n=1 Tax=Vitrella brassicaformis (strain CCMP3155) TaxID=1169540 RepID=A0A0G4F839_VITBC|nr:unnamed protein product [Vitrella brassicaformis CCMP3155]|eukprot:CEM08129.1 unnamed protein product [Vitrella brassicaformis CCMP3155]